MSVYTCYRCNQFKDNDWHPCSEHPLVEGELVCEDCAGEIEDEIEEERVQYAIDEAQTALATQHEPVEDLG